MAKYIDKSIVSFAPYENVIGYTPHLLTAIIYDVISQELEIIQKKIKILEKMLGSLKYTKKFEYINLYSHEIIAPLYSGFAQPFLKKRWAERIRNPNNTHLEDAIEDCAHVYEILNILKNYDFNVTPASKYTTRSTKLGELEWSLVRADHFAGRLYNYIKKCEFQGSFQWEVDNEYLSLLGDVEYIKFVSNT